MPSLPRYTISFHFILVFLFLVLAALALVAWMELCRLPAFVQRGALGVFQQMLICLAREVVRLFHLCRCISALCSGGRKK